MTRKVYYQEEIIHTFEEGLSAISEMQGPQVVEEKCFHCGLPNRYPLIARRSDLNYFHDLMDEAKKVLRRHQIEEHLLSEVLTEIAIAIAIKKAKGKE